MSLLRVEILERVKTNNHFAYFIQSSVLVVFIFILHIDNCIVGYTYDEYVYSSMMKSIQSENIIREGNIRIFEELYKQLRKNLK